MASHWFADVDRDATGPDTWQPCLETEAGCIPALPIWFATKAACEKWIREYVIGADLEDGA